MRIAFLGSKGIPGRHGVEVVVEAIATRLAELGHEVTVFGYDWYMGDLENYRGCKLKSIKVNRNRFCEMPSGIRRSIRYLKKHMDQYDLVHIHSADPCLFAGSLAGKIPVIATSHGRGYRRQSVGSLRSNFSKLAEKIFVSFPNISTCVSPADTEFYNVHYDAEVKYIPNGMPKLGKGNEKDLEEWDLEKGKYILFSAGRILPSKGLHILLDAYDRLKTEIPLVVVGGPSSDEKYFNKQRLRAPEGTVFTGFISDEKLWSLYRYPRVAVFPSEAEAQSMTLLEFLAMGVDVIYSDIPENEIVAGKIGYPFESGSIYSLVEQLSYVLSKEFPAQSDDNCMHRILETHNWDSIVKAYIAEYIEAISIFNVLGKSIGN